MQSNDLSDFMISITEEMAREYERIEKRAAEDPGTAGDQGEENWAALLRAWLPRSFHIVTKGRILSEDGFAGPQVDVLVLHPTYPEKLLDKKLYLAGGVDAAFECKLNLESRHLGQAVQNAVLIRRHLAVKTGSPYRELNSPIIFGLLAHSHSWKKEKSAPLENITKRLYEEDRKIVRHPREVLDFVCVADLATWVSSKTAYVSPGQYGPPRTISRAGGTQGLALTAYVCHSHKPMSQVAGFTPIGTLITFLLTKLSWNHPELRRLADYFFLTEIRGSGSGHVREWDMSIFSNEVRSLLVSGPPRPVVLGDEWSSCFI